MRVMRVRRDVPTQSAILDAAQAMVQQRGYNAFSYHDLEREVGIKTASIHYYFPTKGDLGKALMQRYAEHVRERLSDITAKTRDPRRKLRLVADLFSDAMCGDARNLCMGCMLASDLMTLPNELQKEVRAFFTELEMWVAQVLEAGRAEGTLCFTGPADRLARTFIASLEGALITGRALGDERCVTDAASWFIGSISQPAAARSYAGVETGSRPGGKQV